MNSVRRIPMRLAASSMISICRSESLMVSVFFAFIRPLSAVRITQPRNRTWAS